MQAVLSLEMVLRFGRARHGRENLDSPASSGVRPDDGHAVSGNVGVQIGVATNYNKIAY
jgi:hypothetical protein